MACEFSHVRSIAVGSLPDADPNVTPPAEADLLKLGARVPGGQDEEAGNGIAFYFEADNLSAGTVAYTLWARDAGTGRYVSLATAAAAANNAGQAAVVPVGADCFVQITGFVGFAGAARIITRATELVM